MGFYSFKLPDLGEGIVESEVSEWHVQLGDEVEEDQHVADVMTDKAIVEVSAPVSGIVVAMACKAGEILAVGQELIRFEVVGEGNVLTTEMPDGTGQTKQKEQASVEFAVQESLGQPDVPPAPEKVVRESHQLGSDQLETDQWQKGSVAAPVSAAFPHRTLLASPSLRRSARDAQIDLSLVPGSGPNGRITKQDFDVFIAIGGQPLTTGGQPQKRGSTVVKIQGLRRVIARKMQQTSRDIPHYSYIEEVDVTELEALRHHLNNNRLASQPKLTLLPFIMLALSKILPQFPHCNAHYDDESGLLTQHQSVHIGIATMTDAGLMVPVVSHCESQDIWQSARNLQTVTQAARDGLASKEQLSGSTITITSLGAIGGIATTPIINAPETAIIGINKIQERPVVKNGVIVVRKIMNLSSSFDHRIVDGFDGAQLVQALKKLLEYPAKVFMSE